MPRIKAGSKRKKTSFLKLAWKNAGRVVAGVGLAMCIDMTFADGKYGAPVLGVLFSSQAERNYRAMSRGIGAVREFVLWGVSDFKKDIDRLGDKYGQPSL